MAIIPNIEQQIESDKNVLRLKILSPRQELFSGNARSVSSVNSAGKFDILAEHGNFITLVENKPIIIKMVNKQVRTFAFPLAVIYARKNMVTIFTDIQLELLTS
jgi:F0F1-type ATP synthase epsilon subunit